MIQKMWKDIDRTQEGTAALTTNFKKILEGYESMS